MTITEFAIIRFHSPFELLNPGQHAVLRILSEWQSACSGFPLHFFADDEDPCLVHLVTGWSSVEAHETWIRGEKNQALRTTFVTYVDVEGVKMVHIDIEFERVPNGDDLVIEQHQIHSDRVVVEGDLAGRDLGRSGDVYRFMGRKEGLGHTSASSLIKRWVLKRVYLS